ncbi:integrin beta-2-like isoform X1 [Megalops cyprinoides]|uniref:integrin beta-2-like isoform X1 n=2 Tax=Megalops cyprinoides TaxID=118141 RepID=UPI00186408E9|nr:integrin beta-2-like isoform X1 [Megalops cyprinoides]
MNFDSIKPQHSPVNRQVREEVWSLSETLVRDLRGEALTFIALIFEMYQRVAVLLQILLLLRRGAHSEKEECLKTIVNSCADCIRSGPFCMWCKQPNFTKTGEPDATRCDTWSLLAEKGCLESNIISPKSHHIPVEDRPLSKATPSQQPVQLRPQEVKLALRPGLPYTFQFNFKRAEDYPVDLYYLMDLSYSMKDDLLKVKRLGRDLWTALGKTTSRARIGFGAFVDKTVLPFTDTNQKKLKKPCPEEEQYCQPPFGYRHVLNLTDKYDLFNEMVASQHISGNLDPPEGSLDAIMQAAVCGDKIGWGNSTRLLVLTTDAGFHMAGDGKLGSILLPNDCECHLDENLMYSKSNKLDYPSVGQVARKLAENNIQPIFAVTSNMEQIYRKLKEIIPKSEVGVLSDDSSNVVTLIENAYKSLSSNVIVTHEALPQHVTVTYTSNCANGHQPSPQGTCDNVGLDKEVEFNVTVTAKQCIDETSFLIGALGFTEKMKVSLTTQCNCECDEPKNASHPGCNGHGQIVCGMCSCNAGYLGQRCECHVGDKDESHLRAACQKDNGTECSGLGECVCGVCQCHTSEDGKTIYGKYCECDDKSCEVHHNKLCGGHGKCDCGTCKCDQGYQGSACQCEKSTKSCTPTNASQVCYGRGDCLCNMCQCKEGYKPPFCKECPGCPSPCAAAASCIECLGFQTGPLSKNCSESCSHIQHKMVDKLMKRHTSKKHCKERDVENCWMVFTMEEQDGFNSYMAEIQTERECPEPPNVARIIGGAFMGVALVGIIILAIIKAIIYMRDRKEYKKFLKEQQKSRWKNANPLFSAATTTVQNPFFSGE